MTVGWKKIVRTDQEFMIADLFNTRSVPAGKKFRVRFPSGAQKVLPALIQSETIIVSELPFVKVAERVFFAVPYEGLPEVWVRGIDVEVQEFFDPNAAKKKKKK